MKPLTYQGKWAPGREFRLTLQDGRRMNFTVKNGQDLKQKFAELLQRVAKERAA